MGFPSFEEQKFPALAKSISRQRRHLETRSVSTESADFEMPHLRSDLPQKNVLTLQVVLPTEGVQQQPRKNTTAQNIAKGIRSITEAVETK